MSLKVKTTLHGVDLAEARQAARAFLAATRTIPTRTARHQRHVLRHESGVDAAAPKVAKAILDVRHAVAKRLAKALGRPLVESAIIRALRSVFREDADPAPLTPQQRKEIQDAIDATDSGVADTADALAIIGSNLMSAGWLSAKELLSLQTSYDIAPAHALNALKAYYKRFAFLAAQDDRSAMRAALDQAFRDGLPYGQAADLILNAFVNGHSTFKDDGSIARTVTTQTWANAVARTEMSRASNMGAIALYQQAQVQAVQWVASGGDNMCPECEAADGSVVQLGDDFPEVETDSPPAHTNCVCTVLPADDTGDLSDYSAPSDVQLAANDAAQAALAAYEGGE
jgi:SPP1 gp7 family putative phage head morphogenesis protein